MSVGMHYINTFCKLGKFTRTISRIYGSKLGRSKLFVEKCTPTDVNPFPTATSTCMDQFHSRFYCSQNNETPPVKLKLMQFTKILIPSVFKHLKNIAASNLLANRFDPHFERDTFLKGAEQAIVTISKLISQGNFGEMKDLVDQNAIYEVESNYNNLSKEQREMVKVDSRDLLFRFIYEINILFHMDSGKTHADVTTVFIGFRGIGERMDKYSRGTLSSNEVKFQFDDVMDNTYICNYNFIREYTKDVEDSWKIRKLNHFKLKDTYK